MKEIRFPKDFLFGAAVSAAQVEGGALEDGRTPSIWDHFAEMPGRIADKSRPETACDWYHCYEQDLMLAERLSLNSLRFSFSWSRLLPQGRGKLNEKGLDYYKRLVDAVHRHHMIPNVTLYHWDLPQALQEKGGWLNRDTAAYFGEYADRMFALFDKDIPMWVTLNEPISVYAGYGLGSFAPGICGEKSGRQAMHNCLLAHGFAREAFYSGKRRGKLGIVVDMWHCHPLRENEADRRLAQLENEKTYGFFLNPVYRGCYTEEILEYMERENCMPDIRQGDMELIGGRLDFHGLNCYNRRVISAESGAAQQAARGGNFMENGQELYPKAVYDAVWILKQKYGVDIPIYITENGTCNCQETITEDGRIHDRERITYLKSFLYWIHRAMDEGADIRGYYVWSLIDNWEWTAGYGMRFGLTHVDFKTQQRIIKDSGYWYGGTAKTHCLQMDERE